MNEFIMGLLHAGLVGMGVFIVYFIFDSLFGM